MKLRLVSRMTSEPDYKRNHALSCPSRGLLPLHLAAATSSKLVQGRSAPLTGDHVLLLCGLAQRMAR